MQKSNFSFKLIFSFFSFFLFLTGHKQQFYRGSGAKLFLGWDELLPGDSGWQTVPDLMAKVW